ncbi:hypothetical protein U1Q18_049989 [Sarracenia purpurea var. burkii]
MVDQRQKSAEAAKKFQEAADVLREVDPHQVGVLRYCFFHRCRPKRKQLSKLLQHSEGHFQVSHFKFRKNSLTCKEFIDSESKEYGLQISELKKDDQPVTIQPKGLDNVRQWYLYNSVRPLCYDVSKQNKVAPKLNVPKAVVKKTEKAALKEVKGKRKCEVTEAKSGEENKAKKRKSNSKL